MAQPNPEESNPQSEIDAWMKQTQDKFPKCKVTAPNAEPESFSIVQKINLSDEYLPWFSRLELNNQTFTSKLRQRVDEKSALHQELGPNLLVLKSGDKVVFEAEWTFLGTYIKKNISEEEANEVETAPGTHYGWTWAWALTEDAESDKLKQDVAKITEIDEALLGNIVLTREGMIIRFLLAALTAKLGFEHIYMSRVDEGIESAFGLRKIRFSDDEKSS